MPEIRPEVHRHPAERVHPARRPRRVGRALPDHESRPTRPRSSGYLAAFFASGNVYKGKRPVHWCIHCKTALAEAEIEYKDQTSPSIYVKFPMVSDLSEQIPRARGRRGLRHHLDDDPLDPAGQPGHRLPSRVRVRGGRGRTAKSTSWPSGSCRSSPRSSASARHDPGRHSRASELEGLKARHPWIDRDSRFRPGRLRHARGRHRAASTRPRATATTTT